MLNCLSLPYLNNIKTFISILCYFLYYKLLCSTNFSIIIKIVISSIYYYSLDVISLINLLLKAVSKLKDTFSSRKKLISGLIYLVCLSVFVYSMYMILNTYLDYYKSRNVYNNIRSLYYNKHDKESASNADTKTPGSKDSSGQSAAQGSASAGSTGKSTAQQSLNESELYSRQFKLFSRNQIVYADKSPQTGDKQKVVYKDPRVNHSSFDELLKINPDVVGWIKIPDTRIDYPVLQATDNKYYLKYSINHEVIRNASIYMDYRNSVELHDQNMILYGHNMHDYTMFADLVRYKQKSFFEKKNIIYFDTLYEQSKWEVFSVYVTDTKFNYIVTNFSTPQKYLKFLNTLKEKSLVKKNITFTPEDRILTLSTCSYEFKNARTVVHARLIK